MEISETPIPVDINQNINDLLESKEYELILDKDTYFLKMELYSNNLITLYIRQINNLTFNSYFIEYKYDKLLDLLLLNKKSYDNISKIYNLFDKAFTMKSIKLFKKKEKKIILLFKYIIDFKEMECMLCLNEMKISNEEMIKILFNEIREIKLKGNNNRINNDNNNLKEEEWKTKYEELESKINLIIEENKKIKKDFENKINLLIEENKKVKNDLILKINALSEENKNLKIFAEKYENFLSKRMENFIKENENFKGNPQNLKFKEYLTKNHSNNFMANFEVYTGLKDHIEYLIFNNKNNYNLEIMIIKNQKIITSLKGHNSKTTVIRYYSKDYEEEYILSCDKKKLVIIWDIQNNFNKKYIIQSEYSGKINDAVLLFNIFNNNYILLSSGCNEEFSKLYEFKENNHFVKNIYGTNKEFINFMIPWIFHNEYYIIDCCQQKISINNIFKDEIYSILTKNPENHHYSGYIFNDNYLCVTNDSYKFLRIWDLVNKVIYKEINFDGNFGIGLIQWNNIYTIVGCQGYYYVVDIEKGKTVKKDILGKNIYIGSIKKIKISQLGECLIFSDNINNISLFSF